jgi:pimeloyl-ACP methyl ester carboxylesterase
MKTLLIFIAAVSSLFAQDNIESFSLFPEGTGPFPVLFLLHGHQPPDNSTGGKQLVDLHYLDYFAKEGIAAVALSIPGFGNSKGKRDFSGPDSQKAVAKFIENFCQNPLIDSAKVGIYGISKGATLASLLHLYYPHIALQILEAGWYDLTSLELPGYLDTIVKIMTVEIGDPYEEGLKSRSALFYPTTRAKSLILHGQYDDRRGSLSARLLHEKLLAEGRNSTFKVYPDALHCLPVDKWDAIIPFVRETFLGLYGIGIKVNQIMPVIQIAKIHPGTPAYEQGKLRVGDAILRISPNNDDIEIDVLRMPVQQFVPLLLGSKGSTVRLLVQHFDLTLEHIVVTR